MLNLRATLSLLLAFAATASFAQPYPSKPITIVVPAAAGGPSDTVARVLAPALAKELKGTVIIENQGGAGGTIGAGRVARAPGDGYTLYLYHIAHSTWPALYRNLGDGTFRDVAADVGLADLNQPGTGVSMGAVWGDYDNDGFEDVLIYKWGKPELFHNDGGKHFTKVTEQARLPKWVNTNSAIWFDYDNDGKLDLFIGGYYPEDVDLWHLKNTKMMPESFE